MVELSVLAVHVSSLTLSLCALFFQKVFIELVISKILLLFYVLILGPKAGGILGPAPGIKPPTPVLEGEALTTGPPGKPQSLCTLMLLPLMLPE